LLDPDRCHEWLERTLPDLLKQMQAGLNSGDGDKNGERKRQTRGGKGIPKGKKKFEAQKIILNKQQRKGNKFVTIVQGLASNGMIKRLRSK
jgi:translation initiation factor 1 (eIF-1/SUI1)